MEVFKRSLIIVSILGAALIVIQAYQALRVKVVSIDVLVTIAVVGAFFEILFSNEIIDEDILNKLKNMIGFRNIAVHNYQKLNLDILQKVIENNLEDFNEFIYVINKLKYKLLISYLADLKEDNMNKSNNIGLMDREKLFNIFEYLNERLKENQLQLEITIY